MSNARAAFRLGMSVSGVSRMRRGERLGSASTLVRISQEFGVDLGTLTSAAAAASDGDPAEWIELMDRILDNGDEEGAA